MTGNGLIIKMKPSTDKPKYFSKIKQELTTNIYGNTNIFLLITKEILAI